MINIIKKFSKKKVIPLIILFILGGLLAMKIAVKADTSFSSSNVSYIDTNDIGATTVQGAIDKLNDIIPSAPDTTLKLGDYFTLVPDASSFTVKAATTGYSSDQTITPNELTLWRVISAHSNGEVEAVSEYVSSKSVYFGGITGYANFVGGLQTIATSYAKAGYTTSTRMMGYGGQTMTIQDNSAFNGNYNIAPSSTSVSSPTSGIGREYQEGVTGDNLYLRDYNLVSKVYKSNGLKAYKVGTTTLTDYWIASRWYSFNGNYYDYGGRIVNYNGNLGSYRTLRYLRASDSVWGDVHDGMPIRPIITLKSGVTTTGGSGTKASPYTLYVSTEDAFYNFKY